MTNDDKPPSLLQGKPKDWFRKILIVRSDVVREEFPTEEAYLSEAECITRSQAVADVLGKLGVETLVIPADEKLAERLAAEKPDLCINFVDTVHGSGALSSIVPGIFELLQIPYVGAGTLGFALGNNKYLTKTLLEAWELPTPQYKLFRTHTQELDYELRYPMIVKLNEEHGSLGIDTNSVVTNPRELRARVEWLIKTYKQPVLAEEFIENARELTVVVLEATQRKVFLSERKFEVPNSQFRLLTFETKWATDLGREEPVKYVPVTDLNKNLIANIKDDVRTAFDILRMDDLGRFDVMLDRYNNYYIVDANANPSLGPGTSVSFSAQANGQKFETILINILQRNKLDILQRATHPENQIL